MALRVIGFVMCALLPTLGISPGLATAGPIDSDWDGIVDANDNCPKDFNPLQENDDNDNWGDACDNCLGKDNTLGGVPIDQCDTDGDGYGNFCDADFNQDNLVGIPDFNLFLLCFKDTSATDPNLAECDCNCDGVVGVPDFNCFKNQFDAGPGGTGRDCAGSQFGESGYCLSAPEVAH